MLPQVRVHALDDVPGLELEQGVLVGDLDELEVAVAALVSDAREVGVPLLAVLADNLGVVVLVGGEEVLGVGVGVDEDHAEGVVHVRIGGSLGDEILEERGEHLEPVALGHLLDERADGEERAHGEDEVLHEGIVALEVQEGADDLGGVGRVHLLHVSLNVPKHLVLVQEGGEVAHHVEAIAHVDQWAGVRELGLHEEHLGLLRVVVLGFAGDALNLLDLARLGGCLDVLLVVVGLGAGGDERAEVEEHTLGGVVILEELEDGVGTDLLGVLLAHVDDDLEVLPRVGHEQLLDAIERPLPTEGAEPLEERLGVDGVRVDAASLQVGHIGVVLERAHVQASLLAELRDAGPVVVGELALAEDGVGDVGKGDEVDLEHLGLHRRLVLPVLLEHVEEEAGGLPDHVALEEEIRDGVEIQRGRLHLAHLQRDGHRALRVGHERGLEEVGVVGLVIRHLAVLAHLLELPARGERGDNLGVGLRLDVHAERHVGVDGLEKVAELLGALDLVLGHPRVEKLLLVLREHQSGELDALHLVEDAALQADAEILQERRRGSRLLGDRLEPRDRLGVTEDTLGGVSGALSGTLDVPGGEELLKLGLDEGLGAWEAAADRHLEREAHVVELPGDERHDRGLVEVQQQHLTAAVHRVDTARGRGVAREEDRVVAHLVAVDGRRRLQVVDEEEAHLGDDVDDAVLLRDGHVHREVIDELRGEEQLRLALLERRLASLGAELDDVELGRDAPVGHHRLLRKGNHLGLGGVARHLVRAERTGVRVELLGPAELLGVQLHLALDQTRAGGIARRDADDAEPLTVLAGAVGDDLAAVEVTRPVEHLRGLGIALYRWEDGGIGTDGRSAVGSRRSRNVKMGMRGYENREGGRD